MIRIFEWDVNRGSSADDANALYLTNGLGPLSPTKCTVSETLNGEYELTMEHPQDSLGKWRRIKVNRIIVAPVPRAPHPIMRASSVGSSGVNQFRRLADIDGPQHLRRGPGTDYGFYDTAYPPGTEFRLQKEITEDGEIKYSSGVGSSVNAEPGWSFVIPLSGSSGYIQTRFLRYSRTTSLTGTDKDQPKDDIVVPSVNDESTRYTLRDQAFRIYKIETKLDSIVVYARHISYDYGESYVPYCDVNSITAWTSDAVGKALYMIMLNKAQSSTNPLWRVYTNIDQNANRLAPEEWIYEKKTITEILYGAGGLIELFAGEVARDNNQIYWLWSIGQNRGVYVRSGKNLTGITFTEDWSEVVNRIMPIGKTEDGEDLFLNGKTGEIHGTSPNLYVTKASLNEVPFYRTAVLDDDECDTVAKLKAAAEAEFAKGCDQPRITASVQFELLGDSEEYAQYHKLQGIFLGDTVYAKSNMADIDVPIKMTQYTYNCLTQKYESMTLGTPEKIDLKV